MLLVIDYIVTCPTILNVSYLAELSYVINFATCPTILTLCPTIFVAILKIWSNNYVC